MLAMVLGWTDTFMLGSFKSTVDVGLYNAALPLAQFISFPLAAISFVYIPILSGLFAENKLDEMKRNYSISTKWLGLTTIPLFMIFFLYPDTVINFLFGSDYVIASIALRILSLGYIIHNITGFNNSMLITIGETKFILLATLTVVILNVILNLFLIPPFGIEGAAIASVISVIFINILKCFKVYLKTGVQPISKNLIKPSLTSLGIIIIIHVLIQNFLTIDIWMVIILFVLYSIIFFFATAITKSFDPEDLVMLQMLETKTGIKLSSIQKIIRKFI